MPDEPRSPRRRSRGGRRRGPRPERAPAQPERTPALRDPRRPPPPDARADRRPAARRATRGRPVRADDEIRPGTPVVILLDCRAGELRRAGTGIPRLRVAEERLWGFECWWRLDPRRSGLSDSDRPEIEESKRLLRGLMRDAKRSQR